MTLSKALKFKNSLIGEINRLKEILSRENSRNNLSTSTVDREKVWKDILDLTDKLTTLKSKIAIANSALYERIERQREMKGFIAYLQTLNTTDGIQKTTTYGGQVEEKSFDAFIKQERADDMIRAFQTQVEALQDEIDAYNATTSIEI